MKSATFIKQLGDSATTLYKCEPPMILIGTKLGSITPTHPFPVPCQFVALHTCETVPGVKSTLVHQAMMLQGDDGWGYGGGAMLTGNYVETAESMLNLAGYCVTRSDAVPQA